MHRKLWALLTFCVFSAVMANTGSATLDRPRGYDTATRSYVDNLSNQDAIDGAGAADVASQIASTQANGIYYTALVKEVAGGTITHVYLVRDAGSGIEGWDHDTKVWTSTLANMDPIDGDLSLGYTAANPAIAADADGNVYVAYTRTIAAGADRKIFMSKYDRLKNDVFIWDDGATSLTNNLAAPTASRDSIGNNAAASTIDADNVAPAIAIDSSGDVYIAFSTEMSPGADAKIFLSKFDVSATDAFIWDDEATSLTNNLRAPSAELDSFSVNVANFETSTSPAMAIDSNDNVYVAYLQEGIAGANNRIWLSKFDVSATDAFIWDDGATSLTNNLRAPTDELDSIGNNQSNNTDASGSPSIAIDSNDDVYIAYIQQSENGADPKVWLSKFDVSATDAFIWDDLATSLTNNLRAPDDELNSFGINAVAATDASGRPAILIDGNDDVWVSYVQQTAGPANPHVWLNKFDVSATDVFVWDDATTSLTNNLQAPGPQSGISWNEAADADVSGSPTMALAANGDIYIAYANDAVASSGNPHVNVSYFDVSAADAFVWDDGATSFTNNLRAPTTFTDSLDNSSADGDDSRLPVITATTSGMYIAYLHRPDGTNDHVHVVRIGSGHTPTLSFLGSGDYLSDGADVDAITGSSPVVFKVKYTHSSNKAPNLQQVWIDFDGDGYENHEKFNMQSDGTTTYSAGVTYSLTKTIFYSGSSTIKYRFEFKDTGNVSALGTPAASNSTITAAASGSVPTLADPAGPYVNGVNTSTTGGNTSATTGETFTFRTVYTDTNGSTGTAPSAAQLYIDLNNDGSYSGLEIIDMTPVDASDTNYTDGATFTTSLQLFVVGAAAPRNYYFNFTNGDNLATGTPASIRATGNIAGSADTNANGIADEEEGTSGDLDNDGVMNHQDTDTASMMLPNGTSVGIDLPAGATLSLVSLSGGDDSTMLNPSGQPTSMAWTYGFQSFTATVPGGSGASLTVKLVFPVGALVGEPELWKYNSNTSTWTQVSYTMINGTTISYTIVDGGALDADGTANGSVKDPVGLGVVGGASSSSPLPRKSSHQVCLITNEAKDSRGLWLLLVLLAAPFLYRRLKKI